MHLPCKKNDRLDCLKFPRCSLVQDEVVMNIDAWALGPLWKPFELMGKAQSSCLSMTHPAKWLCVHPSAAPPPVLSLNPHNDTEKQTEQKSDRGDVMQLINLRSALKWRTRLQKQTYMQLDLLEAANRFVLQTVFLMRSVIFTHWSQRVTSWLQAASTTNKPP